MRPIKIATRGSKLALVQANTVRSLLNEACPDIEISVVTVSTKGDRDKSDFLYKSEVQGLFTSEIENAIVQGRADIAVHSLKDVPTVTTPKLLVGAIPKRGPVADALVGGGQVSSIADLPSGATVGTSSLRRIAQLRHLRSDLKCVPLRGNVETRVGKVAAGQVDAAVVACAGLNRLGLDNKISAVLAPEEFLPAPAQGALAVQVRADDDELISLVSEIDDKHSRITAETERYLLAAMHGGCSIPLGVYSQIQSNIITIHAMIADLEGRNLVKRVRSSPVSQGKACAQKLADELLEAGGRKILEQIRKTQRDVSW